MSYSEDFRIKINKYLNAGYTQREARETFQISMETVNSWRKWYKEIGQVRDAPPNRSFKKQDPSKLISYVVQNPYAYLQETGDALRSVFQVSH